MITMTMCSDDDDNDNDDDYHDNDDYNIDCKDKHTAQVCKFRLTRDVLRHCCGAMTLR